jgi:hypothetical protein
MAYIGREPQIGNYQICDAISVVNGQAAYTMQVSSVNVIPESVNHMIVSLNGVIQKPGSSYTISSSTITFSSNLATGDSIDFIYLLGNVLDLGTPSDSTVTTAKLSGNLVTPGTLDVNGQELILDADADTSITADTDDQIDIKVAGADDFQITANTLTALSGSTIKADTIAETTGANGVAVDGLTIKDGKLNTNDSVVTANITDANVTSAKIAGDAITAAKIADDAISEEHLDATVITGMTELAAEPADTDEFLISDAGTLKRIDYSHIKGGGITEADMWRLSATHTPGGSAAIISSNWERADTAGFGHIGTGMTESSGIFTFPSTGFYLINMNFWFAQLASDYVVGYIFTTTNNSSYVEAASAVGSGNETGKNNSGSMNFIFDVTNTSTHKVAFYSLRPGSYGTILGTTNANQSAVSFIRLGDT